MIKLMKKSSLISLLVVIIALVSIGTFATISEEDVHLYEEKEYDERIKVSEEPIAKDIPSENGKSLDVLLKEALLTEEQQTELDTAPQDPLEFIAFIIQRLN